MTNADIAAATSMSSAGAATTLHDPMHLSPDQILKQLEEAAVGLEEHLQAEEITAGSMPANTAAATAAGTPTSRPPSTPHRRSLSQAEHALASARLHPTTDADVQFNSHAFWREGFAPLPRRPGEPEEESEEEEEEFDGAPSRMPLPSSVPRHGVAIVPDEPSTSAADALAGSPNNPANLDPVHFAAEVSHQVEKGKAEADAQAAAAEFIVREDAK